jgi:hypothetical protein
MAEARTDPQSSTGIERRIEARPRPKLGNGGALGEMRDSDMVATKNRNFSGRCAASELGWIGKTRGLSGEAEQKSYTSLIAGFPARAALAFLSGPAQYRSNPSQSVQISLFVSIAFSFFFLLYIFVLVLNFIQILKFVQIWKFVQISKFVQI